MLDTVRYLDELSRGITRCPQGGEESDTTAISKAYKNGVTQTELADWNDVQRWTIYSWIKPFGIESHLSKPLLAFINLGKLKTLKKNPEIT